MSQLLSFNWLLFEDINRSADAHSALGQVMVFVASDVIFLLPLLLLALWFALSRWIGRGASAQAGTGTGDSDGRGLGQRLALLTCVAVVLAYALAHVVSQMIYEPRPFISHPNTAHLLISSAADSGFPSDHTTVSAAIALMLVIVAVRVRSAGVPPVNARLASVIAVLAVLATVAIGVARVYAGAHYPGDILGGILCGAVGAGIATALQRLAEPALSPLVRLAQRLRLA